MKPAAFRYHRPDSVAAALALLTEHGASAKLISGGQSLGPMMNMRLAAPAELIDVNDLTELAGVRFHPPCARDHVIEVGALTRHADVAGSALLREHCPLLSYAATTIGHYAIRQRGTLGGSLAHADPAAQMPLIAATLDARIVVADATGTREVAASDFFVGAMTTALAPQQMIVAVRYPLCPVSQGWAFELFNRRHGDFAIVSIALTLDLDEGARVQALRLGVNGIAGAPQTFGDLAAQCVGQTAQASLVDHIVDALRDAVEPTDDARIPAIFRKELTATLARRAVLRAIERARPMKDKP